MSLLIYLITASIPLIIAPFFSLAFDVMPKMTLLLCGTAALLPGLTISSLRLQIRERAWWLAGAGVAALALGTTQASDTAMALVGSYWRRLGLVEVAAIVLCAFLTCAWLRQGMSRQIGLLRTLTVATAAVSCYGIAQYFGIDPWLPVGSYLSGEGPFTIVRPPATFGHADYFGNWLAGGCFCALASARCDPNNLWRALARLTPAVSVFAVVLSGTRGALLAVAVGALVIALFDARHRRVVGLSMAAALILLGAFVISPAGEKLRARAHWIGEDTWGGARLLLWKDTLRLISLHPLIGFGADQYSLVFPRVQSVTLSQAYPDFHHESPHNALLDVAVSEGLIGLAAWTGFLWMVVAHAWKRRPDGVSTILLASLTAQGVAHLFAVLTIPTAFLAMQVCALLLASKQESIADPQPRSTALLLVVAPITVALVACALMLARHDHRQARTMSLIQQGNLSVAQTDLRAQQPPPGPDGSLQLAEALLVRLPGLPVDRRPAALQVALASSLFAARTADDRANAWYLAAQVFARAGQQENVDRCLRNAVTWSPNWFKPHWVLSQSLARQNRWPEALLEAQLAVELNAGHNAEVLATLRSIEAAFRAKP